MLKMARRREQNRGPAHAKDRAWCLNSMQCEVKDLRRGGTFAGVWELESKDHEKSAHAEMLRTHTGQGCFPEGKS